MAMWPHVEAEARYRQEELARELAAWRLRREARAGARAAPPRWPLGVAPLLQALPRLLARWLALQG